MIYINNAWSSKMLQRDLAIAQFTITEQQFKEAIAAGHECVIGHPDTAKLFGVEENRQTLVLEPGDIVYVCELNNPNKTRLEVGVTEIQQLKDYSFRFLKIIVFEIPEEING